MYSGQKALFLSQRKSKGYCFRKTNLSHTLVSNLFWSFALDKQSCLSWAWDFCNPVITLILTCVVYYLRLWGQIYFRRQSFLTWLFTLSVDTFTIWEVNTAERLWPPSQVIALAHCEATASTASSSGVVMPCKGWLSSCPQRADVAGHSNICEHFIGMQQKALLRATC